MININTYITEKLRLDKDIKLSENYSYSNLVKYIDHLGEINFKTEKIFDHDIKPRGLHGLKLESIYVVNKRLYCSCFENDTECEEEISEEGILNFFNSTELDILYSWARNEYKQIYGLNEKLHLDKNIKIGEDKIVDKILSMIDIEIYHKFFDKTIVPLVEQWVSVNNVNKIVSYATLVFYRNMPKEINSLVDKKIFKNEFKDLLNQCGFRKGYNCLCKNGDHYMNIFFSKKCIYFDADLFDLLIMKEDNVSEKLHLDKNISITNPDSEPETAVDKILRISGIHTGNFDEDDCKTSEKEISSWVNKYNVNEVECIINKEIERENSWYFSSLKKGDYVVDDEDFKYFTSKVKRTLAENISIDMYIKDIVGHNEHALEIGSSEENFKMIFLKI